MSEAALDLQDRAKSDEAIDYQASVHLVRKKSEYSLVCDTFDTRDNDGSPQTNEKYTLHGMCDHMAIALILSCSWSNTRNTRGYGHDTSRDHEYTGDDNDEN